MRRPWPAAALVAWTFFVWTTRIGNIWRDEALDTAGKVGRTALAATFTVLAAVVLVALWRGAASSVRLAVTLLAGWTAAVWLVRDTAIVLGDHDTAFKVVHTVLAAVSIGLAAWAAGAVWGGRATGAAPDGDPGGGTDRAPGLSAPPV